MRRSILVAGIIGIQVGAFVAWWRRHPRTGAAWVNRVADPWLVRHGVLDSSKGEIGLLEHVGRKTGTVRLTPVHPVRTPEGFRIVAPIGVESQWVRNVLAAGHCRLQVEGVVHELDEPRLVVPSRIAGLPRVGARLMGWLGFRYLVLRQFGEHAGTLQEGEITAEPEPEQARLDAITELPLAGSVPTA